MWLAAAMKRQPLAWRYRLLLALLAGLAAAAASHGRWLGAVDEAIFDHYLARWSYPADPSLLIVAIDEASLQQIGPWPWPRSVHARLLDRLTRAGSKRVLLDLPLSEPDPHPGADAALAAAIARNGQVVLPVLAVPARDGRLAEERLPIARMTANAAALGHAEVHVDADGVARGIFLHAGIGSAHWPALGVALADLPERMKGLPVRQQHAAPFQWVGDDYVRLRYAGPQGVPQLSYVEVLEGRVAPSLLHGRRVLVGPAAAAIAPGLRPPGAGGSVISATGFQAHVASMLLQSRTLQVMAGTWQDGISALVVALCVLGVCGGRTATVVGVMVGLVLPLLLALGLLRSGNLWWAPAAAWVVALACITAVAAWSIAGWRRRAGLDALTGLGNRQRFDHTLQQEREAGQRARRPLTVVLIEVQRGMGHPLRPGHRADEQVLVAVARLVAAHARRPRDAAVRLGDDALAMILPDTAPGGARQVAEDLIGDVRRLASAATDPAASKVTLSIGGFCRVPDPELSAQAFVAGADAALHRVKATGGDGYQLDAG